MRNSSRILIYYPSKWNPGVIQSITKSYCSWSYYQLQPFLILSKIREWKLFHQLISHFNCKIPLRNSDQYTTLGFFLFIYCWEGQVGVSFPYPPSEAVLCSAPGCPLRTRKEVQKEEKAQVACYLVEEEDMTWTIWKTQASVYKTCTVREERGVKPKGAMKAQDGFRFVQDTFLVRSQFLLRQPWQTRCKI